MTLRESLTAASTQITRRDAELLLAHTLKVPRTHLLAHPEDKLSPTHHTTFQSLVTRRTNHVPLQHLTGTQDFYGLTLRVTADTLIPRPETEQLVEAVLDWLKDWRWRHHPRILDVGTGTGAIALALAQNHAFADITAVDISSSALSIAQENATNLGLAGRIRFLKSDLLSEFKPYKLPTPLHVPNGPTEIPVRFDIILSNPPYIPLTDAPTLQPEVRDHEPPTALFAGNDGLEIYRRLIPQAQAALAPNGLLALEFGFGQSEAIQQLLASWQNIQILNDYAQIPRIALATKP